MNTASIQRREALRSLVTFSAPLKEIAKQLSGFSWDWEAGGVELSLANVQGVLRRYLQNEIPIFDVETWANMIEGRDDVTISSDSHGEIESVLHELANPYLTHTLNADRAKYLLDYLNPKKGSNVHLG